VQASRFRAAPLSASLIGAAALAMAAPIVAQVVLGSAFIFGTLEYLAAIDELRSIPRAIAEGQLQSLTNRYSALLWLLPAGVGWLCWRLRRQADGASIYFLAMAAFGSFLLLQQYRLEYFGSFALILPACVLFDDLRRAPATPRSRAWSIGLAALIVAALLPGLRTLREAIPLGSDLQYVLTRPVYPALKGACAANPGVVLAEHGDGHYIRFHSECSVIANNFILTPQHVQKIRQSEELLASSLDEVLARAPYVRYVYVRRADNVLDDVRGCGGYHTVTGIEDVERTIFDRYNTVLHELTHQVHGVMPADDAREIQEHYRRAKERDDRTQVWDHVKDLRRRMASLN